MHTGLLLAFEHPQLSAATPSCAQISFNWFGNVLQGDSVFVFFVPQHRS